MRKFKLHRAGSLLLCPVTVLLCAVTVSCNRKVGKDTLKSVSIPAGALYNGIVIPEDWVYGADSQNGLPGTVPYLQSEKKGGYAPSVINIDVGRQLFVDDFLISKSSLTRTWHSATVQDHPVFAPETALELREFPSTACTSGGIWYDMENHIYKMWYEASFNKQMAYAVSQDGIHWERPALQADGGNLIVQNQRSDSSSVWIDYDADPSERYKLMLRSPNYDSYTMLRAKLYTSADGIAWNYVGETGTMGDRSTFFYDTFRRKWVISCRSDALLKWGDVVSRERCRFYHEGDTLTDAATWVWYEEGEPVLWLKTDYGDKMDKTQGENIPELYNFDAIGYESIMLGMFQIWYGPQNNIIKQTGDPKITELQATFSRDGFHYDRPNRSAFIPASRTEGTWDYGYLQSSTGGIIVYDDEIRIYYSAFSGDYEAGGETFTGPYVGGSVGYATLRRDGFASMDGSGKLTTNSLTVTKPVRYLFVNADVTNGSLKAEILDMNNHVVEGYSADECVAVTGDSCCTAIRWEGAGDLSFLQGKGFRIRFTLENGSLYSFWLSDDPDGASDGAVGAGYVANQ